MVFIINLLEKNFDLDTQEGEKIFQKAFVGLRDGNNMIRAKERRAYCSMSKPRKQAVLMRGILAQTLWYYNPRFIILAALM